MREPKWWQEGKEPDYRFSLANERTFLAWIRTALGLLVAALALVHLIPEVPRALRRRRLAALPKGANLNEYNNAGCRERGAAARSDVSAGLRLGAVRRHGAAARRQLQRHLRADRDVPQPRLRAGEPRPDRRQHD